MLKTESVRMTQMGCRDDDDEGEKKKSVLDRREELSERPAGMIKYQN